MSTTSLAASEVMDKAASLMNDTAKTTYTYVAQLPYLQMALDELMEEYELFNISATASVSAAVVVPIGTKVIGPIDGIGATGAPNYPTDLVEIERLWERLNGSTDPYIPISQKDYIPHLFDDLPVDSLGIWAPNGQQIVFVGALTARQVKIDYIKKLIPSNVTASSVIGIINAKSYLQYRTAGLCARFIGENPARADDLDNFAKLALDRATGVGVKSKQAVTHRRRPFRAAYKGRANSERS